MLARVEFLDEDKVLCRRCLARSYATYYLVIIYLAGTRLNHIYHSENSLDPKKQHIRPVPIRSTFNNRGYTGQQLTLPIILGLSHWAWQMVVIT